MDHTNDIQDIIYQLTRISINHDKLNRQEEISQLTPIHEVLKQDQSPKHRIRSLLVR